MVGVGAADCPVELVHVDPVLLLAHELLLLLAGARLLRLSAQVLRVLLFVVRTRPLLEHAADYRVTVLLRVYLLLLLGLALVDVDLHVQGVLHLIRPQLLLSLLDVAFVVFLLHLLHCSLVDDPVLELSLPNPLLLLQVLVILIHIFVLPEFAPKALPPLKLLVLIAKVGLVRLQILQLLLLFLLRLDLQLLVQSVEHLPLVVLLHVPPLQLGLQPDLQVVARVIILPARVTHMVQQMLVLLLDLLTFHNFAVLLHFLPLLHFGCLFGDVLVVPAVGLLLQQRHITPVAHLVVQLLLELPFLLDVQHFLHLLHALVLQGLVLVY